MEFSDELETMVINVADDTSFDRQIESSAAISPETVERWQRLFGFTANEAIDRINNHRSNIARVRVSDQHWEIVCHDKRDYDKESYEFEIDQMQNHKKYSHASTSNQCHVEDPASSIYLLKLEDILDSPQKVQEIASIHHVPQVLKGSTECGDDQDFCLIDGVIKARISDALSAEGRRHFHPTFVRQSSSEKKLSSSSIAPTLGMDATMPQHRLDSDDSRPDPLQNEFPVWYFFYGNLAKEEILTKLLSLSTAPVYYPAKVHGAVMKKWTERYNAVLDGPMSSIVDGWAYQVQSEEEESNLRFHETGNYEVVRCSIQMSEETVKGLIFRYCGLLSQIA